MTELNLSEFVCREVDISFAAISEHGVSDFSPSKRFCIEGMLNYVHISSFILHNFMLSQLFTWAYDKCMYIAMYIRSSARSALDCRTYIYVCNTV